MLLTRISFLIFIFLCSSVAHADQTEALCELYETPSNQLIEKETCRFAQYQGNIYITFSSGRELNFTPHGNQPGNFIDQNSHPVYRKKGLGKKGQVYQMKNNKLYVYWQQASKSPQKNNQHLTIKPRDYNTVEIDFDNDNVKFMTPMTRQANNLFTAKASNMIIVFNADTGYLFMLDDETGELRYEFSTHPIPSFENPDTMCDLNSEPC